jgi:hypothetical protein
MSSAFKSTLHRATGIAAVQLDCDRIEASARLTLRAAGMGQSLEATAAGVIDGVIRFDG